MAYAKGWDLFLPDRGTRETMSCRVCGSVMDVERDCSGPRSWAEAMGRCAGQEELPPTHDTFTCPNSGERWHQQALALLIEAEDVKSPSLKQIIREDAEAVVFQKRCSSSGGWVYDEVNEEAEESAAGAEGADQEQNGG